MTKQAHFALRAAGALVGVFALTFLSLRMAGLNAASVGFVYLILILAVATIWGFAEAAIASVAAMLCYNYFFLPPVGRFTIEDPENWIALVAFLITALVGSHFSERARKQTLEAKRRQRETEQLYALSRAILLTDAAQPVGPQAVHHIAQIFEARAVALYDSNNGILLRGGAGDIPGVEPMLKQVVLEGTPRREGASAVEAWPIALGGQPIGALAAEGIHLSDSAIQALLNLVAIALERVRAEEAANRATIAQRSEEFKSTLLDAIAHEFKTPLTSIKAASTTLLADQGPFGATQREMIEIIDEETDRLNLLVTEAVKMSQIDAGKIKLERAATKVEELWRLAAESFRGRGEDRLTMGPSPDLPAVSADAELICLALRQIIDNGFKYAPAGSTLTLDAGLRENRVLLRITDAGPGIPERDRERVFDKFFRRSAVRDKVPGSGLGLHIAREIARAHGGDLWVEPAGEGSRFCLALPVSEGKK